jgi:hypothetical protein
MSGYQGRTLGEGRSVIGIDIFFRDDGRILILSTNSHGMLVDQKTENVFTPLNAQLVAKGKLELVNSKSCDSKLVYFPEIPANLKVCLVSSV